MSTTTGTNSNDVLIGSSGSDTLDGGNGTDILSGGEGDDVLNGGNGGDTLIGGAGSDTLNGGNSSDTLDGGEGADHLSGGNGDDVLYLDEFDTLIDGQNGFDLLLFTRNGQTLDLRNNTAVAGIESIRLLEGGYNSLILTAADIARISDNDTLVIEGDETATITFTDGGWVVSEMAADGSIVYANGTLQIKVAAAIVVLGAFGNTTIGTPTNSTVTEDALSGGGLLSVSGVIPVADTEVWTSFLRTPVRADAGNLGTLMLAADGLFRGSSSGAYTYSVDNAAVQFLGEGVVHTDRFTVSSLDGTMAVVEFTVVGVNDDAQFSGTTTASLIEDEGVTDGKLGASFSLTVTDVDAGESGFAYAIGEVISSPGRIGTLTYAGQGVFDYGVDNSAVQQLNQGALLVESFDVVSLDGTRQTLTVNITGRDDPTFVSLPSNLPEMIEDSTDPAKPGYLTASIQLTIADADATPGPLASILTDLVVNGEPGAGYILIEPDGSVTAAVANSAVQYLGEGDKLVVGSDIYDANFNVIGGVSFEIIGKNDAAVIDISGLDTQLREDTNVQVQLLNALVAYGQISITDPDQDEAAFVPIFLQFTERGGVVQLAADGTIEYSIQNGSIQYLREGQALVDRVIVTAVDGTTKVIDFTITGANDAPTLVAGTTQGSVTEYAAGDTTTTPHQATGSFQIGDVDVGDTLSFEITALGNGYVGSLTVAPLTSTGAPQQASWAFSVSDSAIDYLAAGQQLAQSYEIRAIDSSGAVSGGMTVSVVITGAAEPISWGYEGPFLGGWLTPATDGPDHLTGSDSGIHYYSGGYGDDWLEGGIFVDTLHGGFGDDRLDGHGGNDILYGEAGNDLMYGGEGNDGMAGGDGNDQLYGGGGDDRLDGGRGDNILHGGVGNDTFIDNFLGHSQMFGEAGNDIFQLGFGANADIIGGEGADLYVTELGMRVSSRVLDFNPLEDKIELHVPGFNQEYWVVTNDAEAFSYSLWASADNGDANSQWYTEQTVLNFVGVPLTATQILDAVVYYAS